VPACYRINKVLCPHGAECGKVPVPSHPGDDSMLMRILLILAVLFAVFVVSGIIYTKLFGPIGSSAASVSVSSPAPTHPAKK
jgi:hypothetical protein